MFVPGMVLNFIFKSQLFSNLLLYLKGNNLLLHKVLEWLLVVDYTNFSPKNIRFSYLHHLSDHEHLLTIGTPSFIHEI